MVEKQLNAKNGWRPAAMWILVLGSAGWLAVIAYLVVIQIVSIADVSTILISIFAGLSGVGMVYSNGRTKEKLANKHEDELNDFIPDE